MAFTSGDDVCMDMEYRNEEGREEGRKAHDDAAGQKTANCGTQQCHFSKVSN